MNFIDDSIVTGTNTKLAVTTAQSQASRRTGILGKALGGYLQAYGNLGLKGAKGPRGSPRDNDAIGHVSLESEIQIFHQVLERNAWFLARFRRRTDVSLIL